MHEVILAVIIAAISGGAITTVINLFSTRRLIQKQNMNEYISKERSAYRENMREYATRFIILCQASEGRDDNGSKEKYAYKIVLYLNPKQKVEQELCNIISRLLIKYNETEAMKFFHYIRFLLWYDWRKAKREAGSKKFERHKTSFIQRLEQRKQSKDEAFAEYEKQTDKHNWVKIFGES